MSLLYVQSSKTNSFYVHEYENDPLCCLFRAVLFSVQVSQTSHYPPKPSHPYLCNRTNHFHICPWMIQSQCHGFEAGSLHKKTSNCLQRESEIRKHHHLVILIRSLQRLQAVAFFFFKVHESLLAICV